MAAARYNQPKPVSPIRDWPGLELRLMCVCGHSADVWVLRVAQAHGIPDRAPVQSVIDRLTCSACGARDARIVMRDGWKRG